MIIACKSPSQYASYIFFIVYCTKDAKHRLLLKCGGCKFVRYCGKDCQVKQHPQTIEEGLGAVIKNNLIITWKQSLILHAQRMLS